MKKILTMIMAALVAAGAHAGCWLTDSVHFEGRVGFDIGGSAPIGMPATIRHLDKFGFTPNGVFGVSAVRALSPRWGLRVGVTFENKGMETDARVKNYHMEITKGGETLAGVFTGNVETRTALWMFTVPVQAMWQASGKVRLRGGVYASYLTGRKFDGWAYDGYLRVDDPTGIKVMLGHNDGERGDYDFSSHLRRWHWGVGVGADWFFHRRIGLFGELNWGMNGIFKSDFHTVEQTLHPIYGAVGITYKIR